MIEYIHCNVKECTQEEAVNGICDLVENDPEGEPCDQPGERGVEKLPVLKVLLEAVSIGAIPENTLGYGICIRSNRTICCENNSTAIA